MAGAPCTPLPDSCPPKWACFVQNHSDPFYDSAFLELNSSSICMCMPPFTGPNCDELTGIQQSIFAFCVMSLIISLVVPIYGIVQGYKRFSRSTAAPTIVLALGSSVTALFVGAGVSCITIYGWTHPGSLAEFPLGPLTGLRVEHAMTERLCLSVIVAAFTITSCLLISGAWYDVAKRSRKLRLTSHSKRIQNVSLGLAGLFVVIFIVLFIVSPVLVFALAALVSGLLGIAMLVGGTKLAVEMWRSKKGSDSAADAIDQAAKRVISTVLACSYLFILCLVGAPLALASYWPSRGAPPTTLTRATVGTYLLIWGLLLINVAIIWYIAKPPKISSGARVGSDRRSKAFGSKDDESKISTRASKESLQGVNEPPTPVNNNEFKPVVPFAASGSLGVANPVMHAELSSTQDAFQQPN